MEHVHVLWMRVLLQELGREVVVKGVALAAEARRRGAATLPA